MKGKIGLVIGLGAGYVLGSRAGRERYEQIKTQWLKVWNIDATKDAAEKVADAKESHDAKSNRTTASGTMPPAKPVGSEGTTPQNKA